MPRILGIDPGSRITGFGVIDSEGATTTYVASGCVRIKGETLPDRLKVIYDGITDIVGIHHPDEIAVEQVFVSRNAASALKLGQARGVAVVAAVKAAVPVFEYTPAQVKQAVTGQGAAGKEQIQHMVRLLLNLPGAPPQDAADALAVALCHGHTRQTLVRLAGAQARGRAGRR